MLQEMKDIDFESKSILDFGTGTGVLAILASKLGANTVTAVDNDEWSIKNAAKIFIVILNL
jgi:ribosomal protein L11 methyltransferase